MNLTVFANFKIDSPERLQRMKDSYESFQGDYIEKWIINARGKYALDAVEWLKSKLGNRLSSYDLNSKSGWFHDCRKMASAINTDYIFYWVEDHLSVCGPKVLNSVIEEMANLEIEYLGYSWFGNGKFQDQFLNINSVEGYLIKSYYYDKQTNSIRQKNSKEQLGTKSYLVSLCGIFEKKLFLRLLEGRKIFLRRWPKDTPFDFEKSSADTFILPIKYGVPKRELFACVDDDNVYPGSSLISRGLYPNRVSRLDMVTIREGGNKRRKFGNFCRFIKKYWLARIIWSYLNRIYYHF